MPRELVGRAEVFSELATEVNRELEVYEVFVNLNPDVRVLDNLNPSEVSP